MAQLAPVIDKLEDVAEPARQFYVPKDGKFHVDLSGTPAGFAPAADLVAANAKVVEFRDNNVLLKKQVDEFAPKIAAFGTMDPVAAKAALEAQEELKKKGINKPDDIAAIIAAANKPLIDQITAVTTKLTESEKQREAAALKDALSSRFVKAGGIPDAFDVIENRARGVFVVENGVVKAAANQFSADKPGEPLSVDEWMTRLTKEASFAFKPSSGSGANPTPAGGGPARPAGQLVLKDPTPQQLGQHAKEIASGKMRVEYTNA